MSQAGVGICSMGLSLPSSRIGSFMLDMFYLKRYVRRGEFHESWFEHRGCRKNEGWGDLEGWGVPVREKAQPWDWGRHLGLASNFCQGFSLTIQPAPCLTLLPSFLPPG